MSTSFAVISLALWLFVLAIPIVVGVFVYRDAKVHHMSPLLWALVAALAPTFLGLIVYLLVRSNHPALRCPQCDAPVQENFTVCPQCGTRLKAACPRCGGPVETGWKVCPHCAEPLDWTTQTVTPPVQAKDRRTGKIVLLVILLPIVLLVAMLVMFSVFPMGGGYSQITTDAVALAQSNYYIMARNTPAEAEADDLMEQALEDPNVIHCLEAPRSTNDGYDYLLYLPHTLESWVTAEYESGSFRNELRVDYRVSVGNSSGVFVSVSHLGNDELDVSVTRDGETVPVEVTTVDYIYCPYLTRDVYLDGTVIQGHHLADYLH